MTEPHESFIVLGGSVLDGLGGEPFTADIRVRGAHIAEVGHGIEPLEGEAVIDASGAEILPGFVDVHSHDDAALLRPFAMDPKLSQGATTVVIGNCGHGPAPSGPRAALEEYSTPILGAFPEPEFPAFADYLQALDASPIDVNAIALVPHAPIRAAVIGMEQRAADASEVDRIGGLLEDALTAGAAGFSFGLMYAPGNAAEQPELLRIAQTVASHDKLLVAHIRNEAEGLEASLHEFLELGRSTGCALHVSHLKVAGPRNFGAMQRALDMLDRAREEGVDVTADVYPYAAGSTTAATMFPNWATARGTESLLEVLADAEGRARIVNELGQVWDGQLENFYESIGPDNVLLAGFACEGNRRFEGRSLAKIARERCQVPAECLIDLVLEERAGLTVVLFHTDEAGMAQALAWPYSLVGSDGLPRESGYVHPRLYGTFPRALTRFAGPGRALSRAEMVRRMTSASADRFGVGGSRIVPGESADLQVIRPAEYRDRADFADPRAMTTGLEHVFVAGRPVWSESGSAVRGAGALRRAPAARG